LALEQPKVVSRLRGMIVISKPVDWEVDGLTSEGGGAFPLSSFIQSVLPSAEFPLVYTAEMDFGFIHRLDVPSSGLVLGGTNLEGLFHLKWQIAVYSICREYLTVNHGHVQNGRTDVNKRIDATTAETMRSLTVDSGKPARSYLASLAHLCSNGIADDEEHASNMQPSGRCNFSALAIAIHTGRRHQIRVHTRHVGHPVATDGRYTPRDVILHSFTPLR